MSIETALQSLADAILVHAEALRSLSGGGAVNISETKRISGGTPSGEIKGSSDGENAADPKSEVQWANSDDDTYGKCTLAEYRKMSKGKDTYSLIDAEDYKARVAAAKKLQADNKAAADKADKVKAAQKAKEAAEKNDAAGDISDEELGAVVKPFAGVEDPKERKRRVDWLKALFSRFGVPKASELSQAQRPEFVKIVKEAAAAVEDDETAELPDLDDMESLV